MRPSDESIADFASDGCIPAALNALGAGLCGLIALFGLFLQWLASSNLNFTKLSHLAVCMLGWAGIVVSFVSVWKLLRGDSYRNLLWALPPVLLMTLLFWLWSMPGARGLAH